MLLRPVAIIKVVFERRDVEWHLVVFIVVLYLTNVSSCGHLPNTLGYVDVVVIEGFTPLEVYCVFGEPHTDELGFFNE